MAFSKSVIAVVLMALLACAAAQGPEPTGKAGRALKSFGSDISFGLGHKGWFNDYHNYHHGGRTIRYVIYNNNKCYDEDWCGHGRKICFNEHYDECGCNHNDKKHHYFRC